LRVKYLISSPRKWAAYRNDVIVMALTAAGVEFTNGERPGVRLRKGRES
jgi:hypothetical protein